MPCLCEREVRICKTESWCKSKNTKSVSAPKTSVAVPDLWHLGSLLLWIQSLRKAKTRHKHVQCACLHTKHGTKMMPPLNTFKFVDFFSFLNVLNFWDLEARNRHFYLWQESWIKFSIRLEKVLNANECLKVWSGFKTLNVSFLKKYIFAS